MPSNWLAFDRIRALTRTNRIFRHERIYQDQSQLDRLTTGGDFTDINHQSSILDQTNIQISRMDRYKDYEQMDTMGEISLALDLYADEASAFDSERKHTLVIRANNKRLKKELEELFFNTLQWDNQCRPVIRYLCKFGDFPAEIVLNENRTAVSALRFMSVYNFTRVETRHGDLIGFFYADSLLPKPQFLHPWQVMHTRLTNFESSTHPYGKAIIDGGRKAYRQLRMMEDSALVYRITRAPERRKFSIPVGMVPPKEIPEYMTMMARMFKKQRFYNPATNTYDERYSPLIQEEDYFLPRRPDGSGPDVDTLPGAENLDQIADIEYFKKKMIAPTKIPFARVGIGEGGGEANEKSLSQAHSEFAKSVQWIQRELATGLTKVALVHLALRGYSVEDLRGFEIALTATSAMEELYRIETWQTRVAVMADLKDLGWFPKEWIVTHFTDLSPDEIEELKDMEATAANGGPGGGSPGGLDIPEPGSADPSIIPETPPGDEAALPGGEETPTDGSTGLLGEWRMTKMLLHHKSQLERARIIKEWARRLNKGITPDNKTLSSGMDYLIESKELDGLSKSHPPKGFGPGMIYNPNDNQSGLLVEWSVAAEDRNAAIKETYNLLQIAYGVEEIPTSTEEVTEEDLPDSQLMTEG